MNVTWFPTLADAGALIDEFVPEMAELVKRPHFEHDEEWWAIRDRLDTIFTESGWEHDESRVAFDLMVVMAYREAASHESQGRQP